MMVFKLKGQLRSGKNGMRVDPRTGRHYPDKSWEEWRDDVVWQLRGQRCGRPIFSVPVLFRIEYVPGDLRRRDVPGLMDALWHCLERAGVVADDSLLVSGEWLTKPMVRGGACAKILLIEVPSFFDEKPNQKKSLDKTVNT